MYEVYNERLNRNTNIETVQYRAKPRLNAKKPFCAKLLPVNQSIEMYVHPPRKTDKKCVGVKISLILLRCCIGVGGNRTLETDFEDQHFTIKLPPLPS